MSGADVEPAGVLGYAGIADGVILGFDADRVEGRSRVSISCVDVGGFRLDGYLHRSKAEWNEGGD